jgi:hypothetical protein
MSDFVSFLMIPLYKLYYIDNIVDFHGLTDSEISSLKGEYTQDQIVGIVDSVRWAIDNRDFDFSSVLPNLNKSNDEIYEYLQKLEISLRNL